MSTKVFYIFAKRVFNLLLVEKSTTIIIKYVKNKGKIKALKKMLPYYFLKVILEIFLVQAFELFDNYIIKLVYELVKEHQVLLLLIS